MEILVCVKRVPDTAENEIEVNRDGSDIERDDLVYSVNEWDNYAVEEAIQIVDKVGGAVTVVSLGDEDSEEVVRREMAMGAHNGILVSDDAFEGSDGKGIATVLKSVVEKGNYDLILTGAQADDGAGQIGGMLAGSGIALGAQNVCDQESGAFTGEVNAGMLTDVGCRFVILQPFSRAGPDAFMYASPLRSLMRRCGSRGTR